MKLQYQCNGNYKGQDFKIFSAKVCKKNVCKYGVVVEVNGMKRHTHIGLRKNMFEGVEEGVKAAKRHIDRILMSLQQSAEQITN